MLGSNGRLLWGKFPFLQGRLRTISSCHKLPNCRMFPFLQGRLRTLEGLPIKYVESLFPFLQGRLRTQGRVGVTPRTKIVSIPSR